MPAAHTSKSWSQTRKGYPFRSRVGSQNGGILDVLCPIRSSLASRDRPLERNDPDPRMAGGEPPLGGVAPHPYVFHIGSSRCLPAELVSTRTVRLSWVPLFGAQCRPQLECRRGSALGGRPAPAGAGARCSGRGSALGGRPAAASSGPAKLAGGRPMPATRLPSRGKAAGKGQKQGVQARAACNAQRWWKGERGSRPALLPESR